VTPVQRAAQGIDWKTILAIGTIVFGAYLGLKEDFSNFKEETRVGRTEMLGEMRALKEQAARYEKNSVDRDDIARIALEVFQREMANQKSAYPRSSFGPRVSVQ
jgi:hypothetical protein